MSRYPLIPSYREILPPKEVIRLEIPEGYHPLSSAYLQERPINLAAYGYVEEEYIIRSSGNIYLWPKEEPRPVIRAENAPFCSRFLLRKPADPNRFSGVVAFEAFNNGGRISHPTGLWPNAYEYLMESGDAWIGAEVQYLGFETLRQYDPERYRDYGLAFPNPVPPQERGPLGWHVLREAAAKRGFKYGLELPDDFEKGFIFDEFFQIAALCRRNLPGDPFEGYDVKKVCIVSVFDVNAFVAGFHPYEHLPGGAPVFDGYIKYMSGSGGELSREADMWWHDDPRTKAPCDVPLMRIETAGDLRGELPHPSWGCLRRREDSDKPGDLVRMYEIAGLSVSRAAPELYDICPSRQCYEKLGLTPPSREDPYKDPLYNFSGKHIVTGAYRNLREWMLYGTPAPHASCVKLSGEYPDTQFVLDENGNHIGGIRTPYLEVPAASYDDVGGIYPFPKEKLRELYGTKESYLRLFSECCARLCAQGWITARSAEEMKRQALRVEF